MSGQSVEVCDARVGPVPKLDDALFWCCLPMGHDGDHEDVDGTWFVDAVARHSRPPEASERCAQWRV